MAKTTKTAVRSTPAKAAKKATTKTTAKKAAPAEKQSPNASMPNLAERRASAPAPTTDTRTPAELAQVQELGQTLADHSLETHQAAAGMAQMETTGSDPVVAATNERVDAINRAVEARNAEAKRLQDEAAKNAEGHEAMRVDNLSVPLGSPGAEENALRVPAGVAKPAAPYNPQGIHPDVTSPVTGPAVNVPGTGVAKLSDLAPGQSLAPSPPISSSNILPQPDKPSFG